MKRTLTGKLVISAAALMMVAAACGGSAATNAPASAAASAAASTGTGSKPECGTVKLANYAWVGYEANVAVIAYLLRNELGCDVVVTTLAEQVSWDGLPTGDVDAILENWGHEDLAQKYITEQKVAVDLGPNGNEGIIGWFTTKAFADANPDILTADTNPQILNKYADQFKTSESGDKGQMLDGDPAYVTNDEAIIANLGLNYKVVYSGSEAASDKAIQAAAAAGKPILAYYWTPNWFSTQVEMVHIKLPPYTAGCDADAKLVACDYPPYHLNKIASTKFMDSGSPAATVIANFKWTNADQDAVATDLALNKLSDDVAAKNWIDAHPDVWKAWFAGIPGF